MTKPDPTDKIDELKAATREANEALKDLKTVIKQATEIMAEVVQIASPLIEETITKNVAAGLEGYHTAISNQIEATTEAVDKRFQTIADILLGEDAATKRRGDPSLVDMARAIKQIRDRR